MKLKTLSQIPEKDLKNKSVLLRIDINSPVIKGKILNNPRFEASSKTIKYLIEKEAKITIIAHQGRKGDPDFLPLSQHAQLLSKYTKSKIKYVSSLFDKKANSSISSLKPGKAILLKNVRSFPDEENIDLNNYKEFCSQFELYINDAFSVSHRKQGSIILPPRYIPSFIGLEFEKELNALEKFKSSKADSRTFILGGSKIEDYFPLFKSLKNKKNKLLPAGILANLFLIINNNLGYESKWLKEHGYFQLLPSLKKVYNSHKNQIVLPIDFGLMDKKGKRIDLSLEDAPFKFKIYDVGNKTIELFKKHLKKSKYIFMKGPLGFSELPLFSTGTKKLLYYLSTLTRKKHALTILGGGHLSTTIKKYKIPNNFSYISNSGGALIKFISGEKLPGIIALDKN